MVAPTLEKLAKEYAGKLVVAKVNTDRIRTEQRNSASKGYPRCCSCSGGKVVHRQVGALPEKMLRDVVSQFMEVVAPS
jgi:thioredoxin 1